MGASSASTSPRNTVISDLNDDCLLEVFERSDLTDLCAIADVSRRFRAQAQSCFASPKYKTDTVRIICDLRSESLHLRPRWFDGIDSSRSICLKDISLSQKLVRISKFLRNFGALVKHLYMRGSVVVSATYQSKYEQSIFELINHYCSGTLIALDIDHCNLTGGMEFVVRPLLLHLQGLSIFDCQYTELFGRMLSLWAPKIRELYFVHRLTSEIQMPLDNVLLQSFPNLLTFNGRMTPRERAQPAQPRMMTKKIEGFLKLNPQLKKIALSNSHTFNIDSSIFRLISTYVPHIEGIEIHNDFTIDDGNLNYVGILDSLNTLILITYETSFMSTSILKEIHSANIPLQHLHIHNCGKSFCIGIGQVVDTISDLKSLKTLGLFSLSELKISHILDICKRLKELSYLILSRNKVIIRPEDILKIIQHARKLQKLYYFEEKRLYDEHKSRELTELRLSNCERVLSQTFDAHKSLELAKFSQFNIDRGFCRYFDAARLSVFEDSVSQWIDAGKARVLRKAVAVDVHNEYYDAKSFEASDSSSLRSIGIEPYDFEPAYKAIEESRLPDEIPGCIDAYIKMVQIVEQRRDKTRLLIKTDPYNSLAANTPKDLSRKYNHILSIITTTDLRIPFNFLDQRFFLLSSEPA